MKAKISLEDVHYGPISAGERELKLLGSVSGRNVLEPEPYSLRKMKKSQFAGVPIGMLVTSKIMICGGKCLSPLFSRLESLLRSR
jgi:hypothetical protein